MNGQLRKTLSRPSPSPLSVPDRMCLEGLDWGRRQSEMDNVVFKYQAAKLHSDPAFPS